MHLHLGCQLVIILVVVLSSCKAKSCKECDWESLIFQLPHKYDRFGRRCSSFSDFFCLHGYWYREKQSNRTKKTKSSDLERFRDLVKFNDTWKAFNWFSFRGAPFYSQVRQYWKHGWKYGVSPEEYLSRVTDFSAKGKILNSIKVHYDCELDKNIILELGFGKGPLRTIQTGLLKNASFFLIPSPTNVQPGNKLKKQYAFRNEYIENNLAFNFFRSKIICREQQWICREFM
ncbi:uncharacterized protein LOC142336936 isoform X1 [Convolutriloba macropyga]|uniref:uncharacterized protein LOC142336936 isoform X1 n=1 Tax=Convolutriloba macropyga TaxID=536237 RepID=UPI003F524398